MSTSIDNLPSSQNRDVTINIRVKQEKRNIIDLAAEVQGKTRSEFMLESAYQKAQDVLLDWAFFDLDPLKYQEFTALLDGVPQPNQKLQKLLTTKSPWE
ncbi:DUF1778 domain-containing protein [Pseudanabaena sp. FACHB-1998]|uniref:type II toxin-antitoxin system TacA family antitoxin n=1 Tax=Pseudanabaena sp. FACHB-1998 TaxID=2692858 RepID=UPI00168132FF|nr:DUF1778 domain-containing protein [Pseudanabaena sp. FACHB-1998]MBD2177023.1 DUF1778 domain-containing protein [Pseudanabaena sp. FACHB-1998]